MELKFKKLCIDKETNETYREGDIVEFTEERAKEILQVKGVAEVHTMKEGETLNEEVDDEEVDNEEVEDEEVEEEPQKLEEPKKKEKRK